MVNTDNKGQFGVFIWTYPNQKVAKTLKISKCSSCVQLLLIRHLDSIQIQHEILKVWAILMCKVIFPFVSVREYVSK